MAKVAKKLAMDLASRMKRAREMGFDVDNKLYHETEAANIDSLMGGGFDLGRPVSRMRDDEVPRGVFMKPDSRSIGVGGDDAAQLELMVRSKRPAQFSDRGAFISHMLATDPEWRDMHISHRKKIKNFEALADGLTDAILATERGSAERAAKRAEMQGLFDKWDEQQIAAADALQKRASKALQEQGYDSIRLFKDEGSRGRTVDSTVVFDPSNIRSVNAAFDPAKAGSSDLLASIGGLAPIAGGAALMAPTEQAQAGMVNPYSPTQIGTALLQRGGPMMPQEAIPAKFPALHSIANLIGGIQDPTGLALDTSGTADYLRNFGEGNPSFLRALGAMPF